MHKCITFSKGEDASNESDTKMKACKKLKLKALGYWKDVMNDLQIYKVHCASEQGT